MLTVFVKELDSEVFSIYHIKGLFQSELEKSYYPLEHMAPIVGDRRPKKHSLFMCLKGLPICMMSNLQYSYSMNKNGFF